MNQGDSFLKKKNKNAFRWQSFMPALGLALALALPAMESVSAENLRMQVFKACRKDVKAKKGEVRDNYCKSATDYMNATNSHRAGGMVWTGVATVCTTACANKMNSSICTYSNIGGSAATSVIEKNFVSGLTPTATNYAATRGQKSADRAGESADTTGEADAVSSAAGSGMNVEACKSAANAATSSYQKHSSASDEKKKLFQIKDSAETLDEGIQAPVLTFGDDANTAEHRAAVHGLIVGENEYCTEEKLKSALGVLGCAVRTNPDLPRGVATEEFIKDLEKATGKTADQFFANYQDPGTALFNGAAAALTDTQRSGLANSIQEIHRHAMSQKDSSSGSGSAIARTTRGSRRPSSEGEANFDMAGALNQLLGQFNEGGEGANAGPAGVDTTKFDRSGRSPAEVSPEDRSFSIFDRVKIRYSHVMKKQHLGDKQ